MLFRLVRVHHWTKNLFCFAGLFFGGFLPYPHAWLEAIKVFVVFCLASSTVYIWNDILDRKRDAVHPKKKYRPLPSGQISVAAAAGLGIAFLLVVLTSFLWVGLAAYVCVLLYFAVNVAYSVRLKHMPLLDINCIAIGFVLRLVAGIYVLGDIPTAWLTLGCLSLSFLLGSSKRRSELHVLGADEAQQRPVLQSYSIAFLDGLINSAATITVLSYALFTVLSGKGVALIMTVPIVYYAVMRYKLMVMVRQGGEEPEMIILRDRGIQVSIVIWAIAYALIVHFQPHLFR